MICTDHFTEMIEVNWFTINDETLFTYNRHKIQNRLGRLIVKRGSQWTRCKGAKNKYQIYLCIILFFILIDVWEKVSLVSHKCHVNVYNYDDWKWHGDGKYHLQSKSGSYMKKIEKSAIPATVSWVVMITWLPLAGWASVNKTTQKYSLSIHLPTCTHTHTHTCFYVRALFFFLKELKVSL